MHSRTDHTHRSVCAISNRVYQRRFMYGKTRAMAMLGAGMMVLASIGCASSKSTINGKVMAGAVDIALAVPGNDARLTQPGLAGARVSLAGTDHAAVPLASTTTLDDGSFTFSLSPGVLKSRMGLAVSLPGYVSLNTRATMPVGDQQLLILLEPVHADQQP